MLQRHDMVERRRDVKATVTQGRYDVVCLLGRGAFKLVTPPLHLFTLTFLFLLLFSVPNKHIWLQMQSKFNGDILYQEIT